MILALPVHSRNMGGVEVDKTPHHSGIYRVLLTCQVCLSIIIKPYEIGNYDATEQMKRKQRDVLVT